MTKKRLPYLERDLHRMKFVDLAAPLILVLTLVLSACAAFAPPKSLDQRMAYAYATHTAVLSAAASSVAAGELSPSDGQQVLALADQSRRILDGARLAAGAGDISQAEGQLRLATSVLLELQRHIRGAK